MGFLACFLLYLDVIFFDTDLCPFRERESCRARNSSPGTQGLPILVCAFRELQELPLHFQVPVCEGGSATDSQEQLTCA
jgi:hypothetical protein